MLKIIIQTQRNNSIPEKIPEKISALLTKKFSNFPIRFASRAVRTRWKPR